MKDREILSFDGLMEREKQARLLKMKKGQIDDFFRRFPHRVYGFVNGLPLSYAKEVSPFCPYIKIDTNGGNLPYFCLWIDIQETMIRSEIDPVLAQCIDDMVKFQLWVHGATRETLRDIIWKKITAAYRPKKQRSSSAKRKRKNG